MKFLQRDGFTRMQYSVYARHSSSKENAEVHVGRIKGNLPPDGEVRIITITDKQFERMSVFWGNTRKTPEKPPCQLAVFLTVVSPQVLGLAQVRPGASVSDPSL